MMTALGLGDVASSEEGERIVTFIVPAESAREVSWKVLADAAS